MTEKREEELDEGLEAVLATEQLSPEEDRRIMRRIDMW